MAKKIILGILISLNLSIAFCDENNMTDTAINARDMKSKFYPKIQVPFTYNYNRKVGIKSDTTQGSYELEPTIPLFTYDDYHMIVEPMLTLNSNKQGQKITNQEVPIQIATYIGKKEGNFSYGFGPYYQFPSNNPNNGSLQSGIGGSYGAYWKSGHFVVGGTGYFSWGSGSNLSGGTANIFYANPTVSYTTDNAYTYTLQSAINSNFSMGSTYTTNQLTLSGAKTYKIFNKPLQFAIGPTYMATTTAYSAKSWGGYLAISFSIPEKFDY